MHITITEQEYEELMLAKREYETLISKAKTVMRKLDTLFYNDVFSQDQLCKMSILNIVFGEELLK